MCMTTVEHFFLFEFHLFNHSTSHLDLLYFFWYRCHISSMMKTIVAQMHPNVNKMKAPLTWSSFKRTGSALGRSLEIEMPNWIFMSVCRANDWIDKKKIKRKKCQQNVGYSYESFEIPLIPSIFGFRSQTHA